jgi:hypothetical protein
MADGHDFKFPEWQRLVADALAEYRAEMIPEKVGLAERAISKRLKESRSLSMDEQMALKYALQLLDPLIPKRRSEVEKDPEENVG